MTGACGGCLTNRRCPQGSFNSRYAQSRAGGDYCSPPDFWKSYCKANPPYKQRKNPALNKQSKIQGYSFEAMKWSYSECWRLLISFRTADALRPLQQPLFPDSCPKRVQLQFAPLATLGKNSPKVAGSNTNHDFQRPVKVTGTPLLHSWKKKAS